MSHRNPAWYTLNTTRGYPLADSATLTDDDGAQLPHHILVDLDFTFPSTAGLYAFVSAVTVTANLVTVVLLGSPNPAGGGECPCVPLAAISAALPIVQGRPYALSPLYPGAGGFVVFGPGILEAYSGRFSTVDQAMLVPAAARPYTSLPIPGVGKLYDQLELTGLVTLLGDNDLQIVAGQRLIDDVETNVIVFQLANGSPGTPNNVMQVYSGQCNGRPESLNCGDPQPIQALGAVTPDCCGVITLQLQGDLSPSVTSDATAAVLDGTVGLIDVCPGPTGLPDSDGNLPNLPGDICDA